jgi:hypothetical protein
MSEEIKKGIFTATKVPNSTKFIKNGKVTHEFKTSQPDLIGKLKEAEHHLSNLLKPFSGNGMKAGSLSNKVISDAQNFLTTLADKQDLK